jgi:hypothetical protein
VYVHKSLIYVERHVAFGDVYTEYRALLPRQVVGGGSNWRLHYSPVIIIHIENFKLLLQIAVSDFANLQSIKNGMRPR